MKISDFKFIKKEQGVTFASVTVTKFLFYKTKDVLVYLDDGYFYFLSDGSQCPYCVTLMADAYNARQILNGETK